MRIASVKPSNWTCLTFSCRKWVDFSSPDRSQVQFKEGLGEIVPGLAADDVPTAQGGRHWWPSTVRAVLHRSTRVGG
jgi:hypothetical protein